MQGLKKSVLVSLWFMFLTFPLMVIRVDSLNGTIEWRWKNMALMGAGSFALSFVWRFLMARKEAGRAATDGGTTARGAWLKRLRRDPKAAAPALALILGVFLGLPWVASTYQTNILISALLYVMLGLGLNIVVGLSGQLVLGYVAFYAVGAYAYAILNSQFGLGFWAVLPLGGALAALFGILLGFPVLRLRGDYLAIVTLGFGEIVRLVLENWSSFSQGPSGIANIGRPGLFGMRLSVNDAAIYIYYLILAAVVVTVVAVTRLKNSRIGRAWQALREDEVACQAMGIDVAATKLTAFALGACWAGFAGVIFAAKTTFINPASFTFLESAMVLAMVVLGGMGSVIGVSVGALVLILLPEYLRAFSEYRMLIFGATMVLMMVFRPQGLVSPGRTRYAVPGGPGTPGAYAAHGADGAVARPAAGGNA